jgi:protein-L-isoaspartate(D-aspartate) O-methyltransferase
VREVYTVERQHTLAWQAKARLAELGYENIHVLEGDGTLGWAEYAPYDRIIAAACGPKVPPSLQMQLALNGRLLMPVGKKKAQHLVMVERLGDNEFRQRKLQSVRFVQLIGVEGFEGG